MMGRRNFTTPRYIERAYDVADSEFDPEIVNPELHAMTKRHEDLLRSLHSVVDSYNQLLEAHGPFHEVELGEPVTRFETVLRKALNDSQ